MTVATTTGPEEWRSGLAGRVRTAFTFDGVCLTKERTSLGRENVAR
jgi:hypothetical protein